MKLKKKAILAAAAMLLGSTLMLAGCGSGSSTAAGGSTAEGQAAGTEIKLEKNQFVVTLYPKYAPITCENFESLVKDKFYDGIIFHRVVDDFMAQGGDPTGTGMGGSSKTIKGEFKSNGVDNQLSHTRGIVSMARSQDPDSASSQFFICYSDSDTFLDGNYAAFGEVTQGMEVVDDFLKVDRDFNSSGEKASPKTPITIDTAVMAADDKDGNHRVLFTMQDFLK